MWPTVSEGQVSQCGPKNPFFERKKWSLRFKNISEEKITRGQYYKVKKTQIFYCFLLINAFNSQWNKTVNILFYYIHRHGNATLLSLKTGGIRIWSVCYWCYWLVIGTSVWTNWFANHFLHHRYFKAWAVWTSFEPMIFKSWFGCKDLCACTPTVWKLISHQNAL
jgi:hypothetical protein